MDALDAPALRIRILRGGAVMRDGLQPLGGQGLRRAECSNRRPLWPLRLLAAAYLRRLRDSTATGGGSLVDRCVCLRPLLEIESGCGESPLTRLVGRTPANGVTVMAGGCTWLPWTLRLQWLRLFPASTEPEAGGGVHAWCLLEFCF